MSKLSTMEKLLDGVEVEWKPLGEVCDVKNGYTPSKSKSEFWTNGTIPWFRMEDIRINGRVLDNSIQHVAPLAVKSGKLFPENSIIISTTATIGENALITREFLCNQQLTVLSIKEDAKKIINHKYLFYYSFIFGDLCRKNVNPGGFALIGTTKVKTFEIPIPCPENPKKSLEIQAEIVRILDTFTELAAELAAELTARKKQYNYYRDQLLSFEEGEVEWKTLDSVFDIFAGGDAPKGALSKIETEKFSVPILSNGIGERSLYGWTDKAKIEKPSLTISARGTIGWTSFRYKPFFPIVRLLVLTPKIDLNLKYAYYYMKTIEDAYNVPQNGIPQLTKPMVKDIKFPVASPDVQARIVATLDKFDALTNSITEGLPREIELRQKQYEYYRDLLLSFPKPDAEVAA